ncbi:MAG: TIGR01777 family oxidoreductase [Pseudomonadota bacterium]
MELVLWLLVVQGVMGAFDNFWHHEFTEDLPNTPSARTEIALHSSRELIYGAIFLMLGWGLWHGWYAAALTGLILIEVFITLWDFIEEDLTRKLPPFERVLHTLLAMNYGAVLLALAPVLWGWFALPTEIASADYGFLSWIMTAYGIGVGAWGIRNAIAAVKLTRLKAPDWERNPITVTRTAAPRSVLVTGATGFIGRAVCRSLIADGHRLTVLTRNMQKAEYMFGPHARAVETLDLITENENLDAIINLAGEPVMGLPWTRRRRDLLRASRLSTTEKLAALAERLKVKPECLINGSAIGYYGTREGPLSEDAEPTEEFISTMCRDWEAAALRLEEVGVRVCRLRFGIVLGAHGGALPPLARSVRMLAGTILGAGRNAMPWLHIDDAVGLIRHALEDTRLNGAINAVAPEAATHADVMRAIGRAVGRPVWLKIPEWPLRKLLGEMSTLLLDGEPVSAEKAIASGYAFRHPNLDGALRDLLAPEPGTATVYYNGGCPICRHEIELYERRAKRADAPLDFVDISETADALASRNLCDAELERRLHARLPDGRIVSGVESFIAIYGRLPGLRWLAALLRAPGFRTVAALAYDRVAVPVLAAYNTHRRRRGPAASIGG